MKAITPVWRNFLFTTWEGGGNVAPAITVARQLRELGHRVRFMCDESARGEAEASGIDFRRWSEAPNRMDRYPSSCPVRDWEAASPPEGVQRLMDKIMVSPALAYARDVIAELEREAADLVVTSEMLPGVMAGCECRGQPFAILSANLCFYPFPGMPAFGPGLPPPRSDEESALHAQVIEGTIQMFDTGLARFNEARHRLGLEPLSHVFEQAYAAELFLIGTSRSFDFPAAELPENVRYVGPLLGEPAWAKAWTPQEEDGRPLIAVGFSTTFQDHAAVLQRIIDAAATLPVLTLVTRGLIPEVDLAAASNTLIVASAPHSEVMKRAAIVVTHGGHGTVTRALINKRPLLVVPHGRDQNDNAVRVTERGAGLSLSPDASVEEIRAALGRLLDDPRFAEAAAQLGEAIERGEADTPAAPLLVELAERSRSRLRMVG